MQDNKISNIAISDNGVSLQEILKKLNAISETLEHYAFPSRSQLEKEYQFFQLQNSKTAKVQALAIKTELKKMQLETDGQKIAFLVKYLFEKCKDLGVFLKFCNKTNQFFCYDKTHYKKIKESDFLEILKCVAKKLAIEEKTFATEKFLTTCIKQVKISYGNFEQNFYTDNDVKINLLNCALSINTYGVIKVIPHTPDLNFTYVLDYQYDKNAKCPKFLNFLNEVLPDSKTKALLLEHIAYFFIPNFTRILKLEKIPILLGTGANGKSVIFEVVLGLFGKENVTTFSVSELQKETYRASSVGKLVNYSSELGKNLDSELMKKLASGEPVSVRRLYAEPSETSNYPKFIFNANELPTNVEKSSGFFRRFNIIEFPITIPLEKQNPNLHIELLEELSGILNLILVYLRQLINNQAFTESETVKLKNIEYRQNLDSVFQFLSDFDLTAGNEKVRLQYIYEKYNEYCKKSGFTPLGKIKFSDSLKAKNFVLEKMNKGQMYVLMDSNARDNLGNYSYYN